MVAKLPGARSLCQRMDDHRAGHRGGWANEQGREILFDPGKRTPVCLLRSRITVEDTDRSHRVVGSVNHIVSHEAFNITDDRNGAFLNSARELFGHTSLGFTLTNGGVHGTLLHRRGCPGSRLRRSFMTPWRGEQQDSPRAECYAIQHNQTIPGEKRSFVMVDLLVRHFTDLTRGPTSVRKCVPTQTPADTLCLQLHAWLACRRNVRIGHCELQPCSTRSSSRIAIWN